MNQETPAIKIKTKDLEENSQALAALIVRIPTQTVRSILDIRYGLGVGPEKPENGSRRRQ